MTVPADLPAAARGTSAPGADPIVAVLAQVAPRLGDVPANLATHLEIIAEARRGGAHLIVFPEMSLTGYFLRDLVPDAAVRLDGPEVAELCGALGDAEAVVGCVLETDDCRFLNVALHLGGDGVHHVHAKVYLPTYGIFDERRYLAPGDRVRAYDAPLRGAAPSRPYRCGILVCEDIWHLGAVAALARDGIELLIVPSSSPGRGVGESGGLGTARSYDAMIRTYAQLTTSYVLHCNRVGFEDGVGFWGGSRIVGPDGAALAGPAGADEALVWHGLDRGALRRARIATPLLRDARHDITDSENHRLRTRDRG